MAFGTRFKAASRSQLRARSTPLSGASPEAIWWEFFDTQTYVSATTTRLQFFIVTSTDPTISNMQAAGQFPDPQWLTIYDVTCDFLTRPSRVAAANATGELDDISQLLKSGRGVWDLNISDKRYGPFSLSLLHGTGGPVGNFFGQSTAVDVSYQWANNTLSPGWNYKGSLIIPPKTNFSIELRWSGALTLTGNVLIRLGLHGILSRRVL